MWYSCLPEISCKIVFAHSLTKNNLVNLKRRPALQNQFHINEQDSSLFKSFYE